MTHQIKIINADTNNPDQMADLAEMVRLQAAHHLIYISHDPAELAKSLSGDNPVGNVLMLYENGEAKAYLLYNIGFSSCGKNLQPMIYMEDIFSRGLSTVMRAPGASPKGAGTLLMEALSHEFPHHVIEWVVADDNPTAQKFYGRINAQWKMTEGVYDLCALMETAAPNHHGMTALYAGADDLAALRSSYVHIPLMDNAVHAKHTRVLCVNNEDDQTVLTVLANSNYSSFRNVTGIETTRPLYVPGHRDHIYSTALDFAFQTLGRDVHHHGLNGHIFACFDKNDGIAQQWLQEKGYGFLNMRDDAPQSRLRKLHWPAASRQALVPDLKVAGRDIRFGT